MSEDANKRIVFYDGDCALCSRSVRMLARMDPEHRLYFAPLQGRTAQRRLPQDLCEQLKTAVFLNEANQYTLRSTAILQAVIATGSRWRLLAKCLLKLPVRWRDGGYNWVAKNRHRLFLSQQCPLDSAIAPQQLLD